MRSSCDLGYSEKIDLLQAWDVDDRCRILFYFQWDHNFFFFLNWKLYLLDHFGVQYHFVETSMYTHVIEIRIW